MAQAEAPQGEGPGMLEKSPQKARAIEAAGPGEGGVK